MRSEEMEKHIATVFDEIFETHKIAHLEYASDANVFDNFERIAKDQGITREQVLMVYQTKHMDGIKSHIRGLKTQREPIQGRIKDAILYLIILWAMENENVEKDTAAQEASKIWNQLTSHDPNARQLHTNAQPFDLTAHANP